MRISVTSQPVPCKKDLITPRPEPYIESTTTRWGSSAITSVSIRVRKWSNYAGKGLNLLIRFISRAWLDRRSTSSAKAGLASRTRPLKSNKTMPTGAVAKAAVRQSVAVSGGAGAGSDTLSGPVAVASQVAIPLKRM